MDLHTVLQLAVKMWAIPQSQPSTFQISYVHQFLSSFTALVPNSEKVLETVLELTAPLKEHWDVEDLRRALELIGKAQLQQGFRLASLSDPLFLGSICIIETVGPNNNLHFLQINLLLHPLHVNTSAFLVPFPNILNCASSTGRRKVIEP